MCKKILWNDLETGGTNPKENAVLQIAAVIEIDGKIVDQFESKVQPLSGRACEPKALEVTGFTMEQIKTFPAASVVYQNFRSFLGKYGQAGNKSERYIMAGYNNQFDCEFLSQWFADISGGSFAYWDFLQFSPLDVLPTLRAMRLAGIIETPDTRLETMCDHFGIKIKAHDALSDVLACRELTKKVLRKLWTGYQGEHWDILGKVQNEKKAN